MVGQLFNTVFSWKLDFCCCCCCCSDCVQHVDLVCAREGVSQGLQWCVRMKVAHWWSIYDGEDRIRGVACTLSQPCIRCLAIPKTTELCSSNQPWNNWLISKDTNEKMRLQWSNGAGLSCRQARIQHIRAGNSCVHPAKTYIYNKKRLIIIHYKGLMTFKVSPVLQFGIFKVSGIMRGLSIRSFSPCGWYLG